MAEARGPDWFGLGVTAPYKKAVASLVDEVEADAATIGAVNNLVRRDDGRLVGINTDAPGFRTGVELAMGHPLAGGDVVVAGAGGAAHAEIVRTFRGNATVELEGVSVGGFDPLRSLASHMGMDVVDLDSQSLYIPKATAHFLVQDQRVTLEKLTLEVGGAELQLQGDYAFDGTAKLLVRADLRGIRRSWAPAHPGSVGSVPRMADLHFAGPLRNLEMVPTAQISQTQP